MLLGVAYGWWVLITLILAFTYFVVRLGLKVAFESSPAEGTYAHAYIARQQEIKTVAGLFAILNGPNGAKSDEERLFVLKHEYTVRNFDNWVKVIEAYGKLKNANVDIKLDPIIMSDPGKMADIYQQFMVGAKMLEKAGLYEKLGPVMLALAKKIGLDPAVLAASSPTIPATVLETGEVVDLHPENRAKAA
jgi:hypothetical protein